MKNTKAIRYLISIILITLLGSVNVSAKDVAAIYRDSKASIVLIVAYDQNRTPLGMGTGFYFRKNLIATNYHIVDGASSFLVKNIGSGKQFNASIVRSYSKQLDIVLIEVNEISNPLPIADDEQRQDIGNKVVVIGNPRGLEGSVSTGIISGIRPVSDFNIYQLTAPISPGSSGGPVFNTSGSVIGIATFTIRESQNLNFAMPSSLLIALESKKMKWEPAKNIEVVYRKGNAGIEMVLFKKKGHEFNESISLKNTTQNSIKNLTALLLYKTMKGETFNYRLISLKEILPPGFAKMITEDSFDQGQNFAFYQDVDEAGIRWGYQPFKVELRVLSYDIVEEKRNDILEAILK